MSVLGDVQEDDQCRDQQIVYRPNDDGTDEFKNGGNDNDDIRNNNNREFRFEPQDDEEDDEELKATEYDITKKDEWEECGDNLQILRETYSGHSKIVNIGKIRNHSGGIKRGSGYGSCVVNEGVHYWKLKILYKNEHNDPYNITFAVGFVPKKYGFSKRNHWFLSHDKSFGLYSDGQIMCSSRKKSNHGITMQNKDIINICLDFNRTCLFVQRCEFIKSHKRTRRLSSSSIPNKRHRPNSSNLPPQSPVSGMDYKVHSVKKIPLERFGVRSLSDGYRLACYLREKGQSITILDYATNPFEEWSK
eukprot:237661_1